MLTRPPKYQGRIDELERRIAAYFDHIESGKRELELKSGDVLIKYDEPPTVIGLCCELDISRQAFYQWLDGEYMEGYSTDEKERILYMLSRARDRIERATVTSASRGDLNPKISAMLLTNMGYERPQDERQIVVKVEGANSNTAAAEWSK